MTIRDILHETYSALSANKVRSGLTMLGIVIGISSVIAMISIGQGAKNSIQSSIQSIGSNLIMIMPGAQRGPGVQVSSGRGSAKTLKNEDAEVLKNIEHIKAVSPELSSRYQVTAKGQNTNTSVVGVAEVYPEVRNVQIENGSFINDQQVRNISKVAVLGQNVVQDLFGDGAASDTSSVIGQSVRIKGVEFKIIGVTQIKGGTGFGSQDDMIFVPISSAQRFLAGDSYLSNISISVDSDEYMSDVQQVVTDTLLKQHKINDSANIDFNILNQADIVATASSVASTFTILLAAVAGISLIVGGIGIMNMMLTTVTERTREIGLRKAIGARKSDINKQFLAEAVTLTCVGGVIGVLLGISISYGVEMLGILQTSVSSSSVILAFGVSALIGVLFGYYPAKRASSLNPVEALRYE